MRQAIHVNLPTYVYEMLVIMIKQCETLMTRHCTKLKFETESDALQVFTLTEFVPNTYSREKMKEFKFHLVHPFRDYSFTISGLNFDATRKLISYKFSVDADLCAAINQGLRDSPNIRGNTEPIMTSQPLMTVSDWPAQVVLDQMNGLVKKMVISDHFCHQDILCNTRHDTPALRTDTMYRLALTDDSLGFLHNSQITMRQADLMQKRRTGRQIISIPAQPAQVVAVPGNEQENADELATLQVDLARIQARLQVLNPVDPVDPGDPGAVA